VDKVTGAREQWFGDGLDGIAGVDSGLWVSDVDYVAGWRDARDSADRLNRALLSIGFELSAVRAVASTNEDGHGVVRLAGRPGDVNQLAVLLEGCVDAEGGAA
jgi:hypothetical protein